MTVAEMIARLQTMDQSKEVWINLEDGRFFPTGAENYNGPIREIKIAFQYDKFTSYCYETFPEDDHPKKVKEVVAIGFSWKLP